MKKSQKGILFRDSLDSKFEEGGRKWFKSSDQKTHVIYEGDIFNGVSNGKGTFTSPNGGKHVIGEWKDGQAWSFKTVGTIFQGTESKGVF